MAKLPGSFNADDHGDMGSFDPIPAGEYTAEIIESEMKPTKAALEAKEEGDKNWAKIGQRLVLKFSIISGEFKGRTLLTGLNIINKNPQAVEISQKELATICRAVGLPGCEDSEELHGKPMTIKVKVKPESANYAASNEITNYKALEGLARPSKPKSDGEDAPAATAGKKKKAWEDDE